MQEFRRHRSVVLCPLVALSARRSVGRSAGPSVITVHRPRCVHFCRQYSSRSSGSCRSPFAIVMMVKPKNTDERSRSFSIESKQHNCSEPEQCTLVVQSISGRRRHACGVSGFPFARCKHGPMHDVGPSGPINGAPRSAATGRDFPRSAPQATPLAKNTPRNVCVITVPPCRV